jgi:hypothetical protein
MGNEKLRWYGKKASSLRSIDFNSRVICQFSQNVEKVVFGFAPNQE